MNRTQRATIRCPHCKLNQFDNVRFCRKCRRTMGKESLLVEMEKPQSVWVPPITQMSIGLGISRAIKGIRTSRGMRQEDVASKMNMPRTYISDLERGVKIPGWVAVRKLATAFSLHPMEIVDAGACESGTEGLPSIWMHEVTRLVPHLDNEAKLTVLQKAAQLAESNYRRSA